MVRFIYGETNFKDIPGITEHDTIGYKIEALRVYLEQQIGETVFYQAYHLVKEESDSDGEDVNAVVPPSGRKFISLIFQLIVCEDSYYGATN